MHYRTKDYREFVMKTARTKGAVGKNALVPKVVQHFAKKKDLILDFGCGPQAQHVINLREKGYEKTYGMDMFFQKESDIPLKLKGRVFSLKILEHIKYFDIVYASNVINVQPSLKAIDHVFTEMIVSLKPEGKIIFNYPQSPRKNDMTTKEMDLSTRNFFRHVVKLPYPTPIWIISKQPTNIDAADLLLL